MEDPTVQHQIYYRNPIDVIKSLWSNPTYANQMVFSPQKLQTSSDKTSRLYNEMWTGDWWWKIQVFILFKAYIIDLLNYFNIKQDKLPKGATVAPVIISSDKTQLTEFSGNKQAYPVYLTIGNIPGRIRHKPNEKATILLAYLSADKILSANISQAKKTAQLHQLFHESMKHILEPLISAGKHGINMVDGKGNIRQVHPILACYAADYPEQCLVTTAKYNTCPKCHAILEDFNTGQLKDLRTSYETLQNIDYALDSTKGTFKNICHTFDLNGHTPDPFWSDLPYTDIHMSITPDILHQVNSGVFSHLTRWCELIATGNNELDRHISQLPLLHGICHFPGGFSILM